MVSVLGFTALNPGEPVSTTVPAAAAPPPDAWPPGPAGRASSPGPAWPARWAEVRWRSAPYLAARTGCGTTGAAARAEAGAAVPAEAGDAVPASMRQAARQPGTASRPSARRLDRCLLANRR